MNMIATSARSMRWLALLAVVITTAGPVAAEELPWKQGQGGDTFDCSTGYGNGCSDGAYAPEPAPPPYAKPVPLYNRGGSDEDCAVAPPRRRAQQAVDDGYQQPPEEYVEQPRRQDTFSSNEITAAGHRFFGNITKGLASVIEYAFQQQGRPNGYILGEEGGGAFFAGLRYGEGVLHTKTAGKRRVYWQGPSIGYDFGGEGSKTMILVYDMYSPDEVYYDYVGVDGSAYLVGGVGITFMKSGHVTMAPIRSGLGLRLGANVGYLKFTRQPTWNPF
jgi:hypothetical protein